ncbi:unnamed protein product [Tuber melanosporum]|uniref:(Perigord truffle) hypothetical protein n=1 Tax=Tuber melanosporum (strain Mel28) TaxID=656061 RepID=D5GKV8_TUBMM|nr:uncharacterized protein GSTUM_00009788001 [Tuber melanosporum]CAZ85151.1 unnamed protein product [Tuber melanosporum]
MSAKDASTLEHGPCANSKEWASQLEALKGLPESYSLSKTLVFKPKTPKTQTAVLVVVVALEDTTTSSSEIQKTLDVKDTRMANDDAVNAALGVKPADVSPLTITKDNSSAVQVLLDQRLVDAPKVAIHPSGSNTTSFVSGADVKRHLEETGVKLTICTFNTVAIERRNEEKPKVGLQKVPIKSTKAADARIPDAELIGITTQKEIDFSNWYQQVLTKGDMLEYYDISGCYILKAPMVVRYLGESPRLITAIFPCSSLRKSSSVRRTILKASLLKLLGSPELARMSLKSTSPSAQPLRLSCTPTTQNGSAVTVISPSS